MQFWKIVNILSLTQYAIGLPGIFWKSSAVTLYKYLFIFFISYLKSSDDVFQPLNQIIICNYINYI